jgi:hypothetical protein
VQDKGLQTLHKCREENAMSLCQGGTKLTGNQDGSAKDGGRFQRASRNRDEDYRAI